MRAPAVFARPVISSSGSSPADWPSKITRTRTAFSLATPSARSVSYTAGGILRGRLALWLDARERGSEMAVNSTLLHGTFEDQLKIQGRALKTQIGGENLHQPPAVRGVQADFLLIPLTGFLRG